MPTLEKARDWYPTADPVHGYDHVLRVYHLAEKLATTAGADVEIVRAAVLLHDALAHVGEVIQEPSSEPELGEARRRAGHHHHSAEFAQQVLRSEGWPETRIAAVLHCIRAHRFRDESESPQSLEAQILFDADKLDAIGAVGVARAVAYATRNGQPFFAQPSEQFLESGVLAEGEAHSAYHEYLFKLRWLKDRLHTQAALVLAEERHRFQAEYFRRLAAEIAGEE